MKVTYVLAVHNLRDRIGVTVEQLLDHLQPYPGSEVIMVENASTDGTQRVLHTLTGEHRGIKVVATHSPKGLGSAYRKGIQVAAGDVIVLEHGDLPFGFTDFDNAMALSKRAPLVFASKAHPGSVLKQPPLRRILTRAFTWIRTLLVQLDIGDSQGTIVIDAALAKSLLPYLFCDNYLITTEIGVLAARNGVEVVEVPVIYPGGPTPSTISPLSDSWKMLLGLWELRSRAKHVHGLFKTAWRHPKPRTTFQVPHEKPATGLRGFARFLGVLLLTVGILGAARLWATTALDSSSFNPANLADNWLPTSLLSFVHRGLPASTSVFMIAAIAMLLGFAAAFHMSWHLLKAERWRFFVSFWLVAVGLDLSIGTNNFALLWFFPVLMAASYGLAVAHEHLAAEPVRIAALITLSFLCSPPLALGAIAVLLLTFLATSTSLFMAVKRLSLLCSGTALSLLLGVVLLVTR